MSSQVKKPCCTKARIEPLTPSFESSCCYQSANDVTLHNMTIIKVLIAHNT
jgi:hypothetical protein